ncbi:hypothetical protein K8T06_10470 [bacterium]|nr:hypothetical protein [bacterium]
MDKEKIKSLEKEDLDVVKARLIEGRHGDPSSKRRLEVEAWALLERSELVTVDTLTT